MRQQKDDLRNCATALECRDRLPELAAWMSDEVLAQLPIWRGPRFERGQEYFDLDNPERGPFVATGDEKPPTDWTYVCRAEATERAWAQLVTWRQPVSRDEAEAREWQRRALGIGREVSGAGDARTLPRGAQTPT
jgi:hypothetical protein